MRCAGPCMQGFLPPFCQDMVRWSLLKLQEPACGIEQERPGLHLPSEAQRLAAEQKPCSRRRPAGPRRSWPSC